MLQYGIPAACFDLGGHFQKGVLQRMVTLIHVLQNLVNQETDVKY